MPTSRTYHQRCHSTIQFIALPLGTYEADRAFDSIPKIGLTLKVIHPGRRIGILKVSHEYICARVERVDNHLAIGRSGNLHAPVQQVMRDRCDLPIALTNICGIRKEIWHCASVNLSLANLPPLQDFTAPCFKLARQLCQKAARLRCEDQTFNVIAGSDGSHVGHRIAPLDAENWC